MDSNTLYFVMQGEDVRGPYTLDFIEGMILSDLVRPDAQVYKEGGSAWVDVRTVLAGPTSDESVDSEINPEVPTMHATEPSLTSDQLYLKKLQAEMDRRKKIKLIEEDTARKLAQIQSDLVAASNATNALAAKPYGMKMLKALNAFNATLYPDVPKASVLRTLRLASDISPQSNPSAEIQLHADGYIPVAYAIEQLGPNDAAFASAFLKIVSGNAVNGLEKAALTTPTKSGIALVQETMDGRLIPTNEGLEYIKQLVPVVVQVGILEAGRNAIVISPPKRPGGFFSFFKS